MKKMYFLFLTVLICSLANAQITKGDIILGGNVDYTNSTTTNTGSNTKVKTRLSNLTIDPSFGKAIKDNLVLGFNIDYTRSTNSSDEPNNGNLTGNGFGAGVFLRKYIPLGNHFYFFGQTALSGTYTHSSLHQAAGYQPLTDITNSSAFSLSFFPGIAYAINHKWQLETGLANFFGINYSHSKETATFTGSPAETNTSNYFSVASELSSSSFLVGVRYFIGN